MRVQRLGGASAIAKRMLISAIIIALVMASCIAPVFAENLPATNDVVKLDNISDKAPGDTVTISGTTTFAEISIKVLDPDKTILYVSTVTGGNFTNTFTLPKDTKVGTYEVVAGVGTEVATTTFKVEEELPPTIISIDEVSVTTKAGTAPVLPKEVTARYSDGSSKNVAVVWDKIDPAQYAKAGTFTVEGTVEGTSIKAKATVTVAPISVDEVKLDSIADKVPGDTVTVSGTTTFGEITIKVIAPNKTVLYVATAKGGNFTKTFTLPKDAKPGIYEVVAGVGYTVATTTFKVETTELPTIISIDEVSVTTKVRTAPVLPKEVTARYSDGSSRNVAVIWDEIDPSMYAKTGTFTVEGTVEGTDIKAIAKVKVRATGGGSSTVPPIITEDDSTEIEAEPGEDSEYIAKFGKEALKKAIEEAENGIARLKVTGAEDAGELIINIPSEDMELAIEKGIKRIEVETDQAVFSINPEILKNSNGEYPSNIELTVKKVDTSALPEETRNLVGNNTAYDFGLSADNEAIDSFETGDVVVSVDYALKPGEDPNKVVVYQIDDNGSVKAVVNGRYNPETGKVEFALKEMGMYAAVYNDVTFSDISSVPWAKEAIEYLAARGVISGSGDGTFRPNDNVTRAEFIKMLMMALELEDEEAVCTFSDVKKGAWYYRPIATAEKLGIVKGKGDGTFGVNDEILRQDMAVMIYRIAQLLGIDLGDDISVEPFKDEAEISGYAKEAVAAMQRAGIIKGTGDGSFAPKNTATRAEAAVIIYRLIKK